MTYGCEREVFTGESVCGAPSSTGYRPSKDEAFADGVHVAALGGTVWFGLTAASHALGLPRRTSTAIERVWAGEPLLVAQFG